MALRDEMAGRRRAEAAQAELLHGVVGAQEGERRQVSRDPHDALGQEPAVPGLAPGRGERDGPPLVVEA